MFFSLVLPPFWGHAISDPAGTKEEQEMREAEQTRLQKAGPTGNTIADLVTTDTRKKTLVAYGIVLEDDWFSEFEVVAFNGWSCLVVTAHFS